MPLSKKRDRGRKQVARKSNLAELETKSNSNLDENLIQPKPSVGRLELARQVLANAVKPKTDAPKSTTSPLPEESNSRLYNPKTSRPGELVRKWIGGRYVEVIVKEVDAEGNEVPEYY